MNLARSSTFFRKLVVLLSGSTLSQLIALAFVPVLTRLYAPEAFGTYGVLLAIAAVLSVFSTLRLERALVVSKSVKETDALLLITVCLSVFVGVLIYVFGIFIPREKLGNTAFDFTLVKDFGGILSILVSLIGLEAILRNYALKKMQYGQIAASKAVHSSAQGGSQVALSEFEVANGLVWGAVASLMLRVGWLLGCNWSAFLRAVVRTKLSSVVVALRRSRSFIKYMAFASLLAALLSQILVFLSSVLLSASVVGQLFLAQKLLVVPMSLLTRAITDVSFQEFSTSEGHKVEGTYQRRLVKLLKYGALPFLIAALLSPLLFPWVLGKGWEDTGLYASCLLPGLFVQFAVAPFGTILWVLKRNREFLYLTFIRLLLLALCMYVGNAITYGFGLAIGYSVGLSLGYLLQHILLIKVLRFS